MVEKRAPRRRLSGGFWPLGERWASVFHGERWALLAAFLLFVGASALLAGLLLFRPARRQSESPPQDGPRAGIVDDERMA